MLNWHYAHVFMLKNMLRHLLITCITCLHVKTCSKKNDNFIFDIRFYYQCRINMNADYLTELFLFMITQSLEIFSYKF